jgi:hypothetical protein
MILARFCKREVRQTTGVVMGKAEPGSVGPLASAGRVNEFQLIAVHLHGPHNALSECKGALSTASVAVDPHSSNSGCHR